MKRNKLKLYGLELVLIIVLFFALFTSKVITKPILAVFMFIYWATIRLIFGKKGNKSTFEKPVSIIMAIFSGAYLGVFYLLGLYYGFSKVKYPLSIYNFVNVVIPITVIIICSEVIRKYFLSQNGVIYFKKKKYNFSLVLTYVSMTLVDLTIYAGVYDLTNLSDFLMAIGFVLFASLSSNLLYNYMSVRFGYKPVIIYRMITTLYMYLLPVIPDVYILLRSFLRMLVPYIIYILLEKTYAKTSFATSYKERKKDVVWLSILLVIITSMIMLISCQFKYGIIVVGSKSMTGSINKGDVIIFEKYKEKRLEEGQIIIFNFNNIKTIHRIVEIRVVNGETRYFTQGDANKTLDSGYRVNSDIQGLVNFRIGYIGLPTLWLSDLFK